MIVNITKGSNPKRLIKYLLEKDKDLAQLRYTNMSGRTIEELAEEFRFSHDLNRRVKKNMIHYSVSLPPGERVSAEKIQLISQDLLEQMGHYDTQFLVVEHHDRSAQTGCQHWHIAASRVRLDGTCASDSFERYRIREVERNLEKSYGLIPKPKRDKSERKNLTAGEYRLKERTLKKPAKERLWEAIDAATTNYPTMPELINRLKDSGIDAKVGFTRTGKIKGITYSLDNIRFSGTQLGGAYTFGGLTKHKGVFYDPDFYEAIKQASARETATPPEPSRSSTVDPVQMERVQQVAAIAADYLNLVGQHHFKGSQHTLDWNEIRHTLTISETSSSQTVLKANWDRDNKKWIDTGSNITLEKLNYFLQVQERLQQEHERLQRELEKRRLQSRCLDKGLEL